MAVGRVLVNADALEILTKEDVVDHKALKQPSQAARYLRPWPLVPASNNNKEDDDILDVDNLSDTGTGTSKSRG